MRTCYRSVSDFDGDLRGRERLADELTVRYVETRTTDTADQATARGLSAKWDQYRQVMEDRRGVWSRASIR